MEFTAGRRIRQTGRRFLGVAGVGLAAMAAWFVAEGRPDHLTDLAFPVLACALCMLLGVVQFARLRKPFRLVVDDFGVTTYDGALSWAQIEAIALRYPEPVYGEDGTSYPAPLLTLRPVAGVTLPRKPDPTRDGRLRYTLLDTDKLDQGISELTDALAYYGGERFETVPLSVRPPAPPVVADAAWNVPGGECVFLGREPNGARFLTRLGVACVLTVPAGVVAATSAGHFGTFWALWGWGTVIAWGMTIHSFRRWRRPLRLRIGPGGIGMREYATSEFYVPWSKIAAVVFETRPGTSKQTVQLTLLPLPGADLGRDRTHLIDGHQAYTLVRLDRLHDGEHAVAPALETYAGERFSR
ncbi:hypothetical protein [Actinacidiphila glaucinigra]|uniref:Uncharacterized protein n=1 Tax=Actinacidiphila glaucinigra TaxID=235986 RepID=A0A239MPW1_9ACTN|nr:hypothetical protein [Actinacidiphila glaucinigra]SNT44530.1 hypothetical protein SAMN05216252_12628 [Actinacidiphila glaucinigra]